MEPTRRESLPPPSTSATVLLHARLDDLRRDMVAALAADREKDMAERSLLSEDLKAAQAQLRESEARRSQLEQRLATSMATLHQQQEETRAGEAMQRQAEARISFLEEEGRRQARVLGERERELVTSRECCALLEANLEATRAEVKHKAADKQRIHKDLEEARAQLRRLTSLARAEAMAVAAAPAEATMQQLENGSEAMSFALAVVDTLGDGVDPSGRLLVETTGRLLAALGFLLRGASSLIDGPRDGGIDIRVWDEGENVSLVQCKCKRRGYLVVPAEVEAFASAVASAGEQAG
jgi:hypothetical protein